MTTAKKATRSASKRKSRSSRKIERLEAAFVEEATRSENKTQTIRNLIVQRDEAYARADKARIESNGLKTQADKFMQASFADAQRRSQHMRKLFRTIFDLKNALARKAGYIDRVNDVDGRPTVSVAQDADIPSIRADLINGTERDTDKILEGIDDETLDIVLGRGADDDIHRS